MKFVTFLLISILVFALGLVAYSRYKIPQIEARFPPIGSLVELGGGKMHYLDIAAQNSAMPPVLFVHGASSNLRDLYGAFEPPLKGEARMIFVDRPGLGYSDRAGAENPAAQATRYKLLLDHLKIDKVVLVGHSLGAASVAAFAVLFPQRVQGIVFVAPATHPWPGGVHWYYDVASTPLISHLFTETLLVPVGLMSVESGANGAFAPNEVPKGYVTKSGIPLVLRPSAFRANARDVAGLLSFVKDFSKRYSEITKPVVIITGDTDDVVAPDIHSLGLERAIEGAELVILRGVGHKPDYVATDRIVEAIRKVGRVP